MKNLGANARDVGAIPESGRPPGEGKGNPLQYSCLKISTHRSLVGYNPGVAKELYMMYRLNNSTVGDF